MVLILGKGVKDPIRTGYDWNRDWRCTARYFYIPAHTTQLIARCPGFTFFDSTHPAYLRRTALACKLCLTKESVLVVRGRMTSTHPTLWNRKQNDGIESLLLIELGAWGRWRTQQWAEFGASKRMLGSSGCSSWLCPLRTPKVTTSDSTFFSQLIPKRFAQARNTHSVRRKRKAFCSDHKRIFSFSPLSHARREPNTRHWRRKWNQLSRHHPSPALTPGLGCFIIDTWSSIVDAVIRSFLRCQLHSCMPHRDGASVTIPDGKQQLQQLDSDSTRATGKQANDATFDIEAGI